MKKIIGKLFTFLFLKSASKVPAIQIQLMKL